MKYTWPRMFDRDSALLHSHLPVAPDHSTYTAKYPRTTRLKDANIQSMQLTLQIDQPFYIIQVAILAEFLTLEFPQIG